MIIRPFYRTEEKPYLDTLKISNSLNFEVSKDFYGNVYFHKKRIGVNDKGAFRCEEINIFPKTKTLIKETTFGSFDPKDELNLLGRNANSISRIRSTLDLKTGKLVEWGSESPIPSNNGSRNFQVLGFLNTNMYGHHIRYEDKFYQTDKIENGDESFDIDSVKFKIYGTEDNLQMGYIETVGLMETFFSQWSFDYPFESSIIIDSKDGFNIVKLKYLKGILEEEAALKLFSDYLTGLDKLTELFKYNCFKEKRHIRVYVYTSAFCAIIKIHDCDHREIKLDSIISGSNHFKTLIFNKASNPNYYDFSEEAGIILRTRHGNISDEFIKSLNYLNDENLYI